MLDGRYQKCIQFQNKRKTMLCTTDPRKTPTGKPRIFEGGGGYRDRPVLTTSVAEAILNALVTVERVPIATTCFHNK